MYVSAMKYTWDRFDNILDPGKQVGSIGRGMARLLVDEVPKQASKLAIHIQDSNKKGTLIKETLSVGPIFVAASLGELAAFGMPGEEEAKVCLSMEKLATLAKSAHEWGKAHMSEVDLSILNKAEGWKQVGFNHERISTEGIKETANKQYYKVTFPNKKEITIYKSTGTVQIKDQNQSHFFKPEHFSKGQESKLPESPKLHAETDKTGQFKEIEKGAGHQSNENLVVEEVKKRDYHSLVFGDDSEVTESHIDGSFTYHFPDGSTLIEKPKPTQKHLGSVGDVGAPGYRSNNKR
jgi:hypothetical protein